MSIGRLVVDLMMRTGQFETDAKRAAKEADKLAREIDQKVAGAAKKVAAAGVVAAAGLAFLVKASIDSADSLNDLSKSSGESVETLSSLGYAAEQSGADLETLSIGLKKLASSAFDAARGVKAPADTFKQLGIQVKNADGTLKSNRDLLLEIADVFSQYQDGVAKSALAQDIFGKSGDKLIPFLNQGRDGIKELTEEAVRLGVVVSGETAQAADDFNDNLAKLKASASGVGLTLASELLPALVDVTGEIVEFIKQGDGVAQFANAVANSFRFIVDVGSRVSETFQDIGNAIGALYAAQAAVLRRDFAGALNILKEAHADGVKRDEEYTEFRKKLWDNAGKSIVASAKAADAGLQRTKVFGAGVDDGPVQEIDIKVPKFEESGLASFYDDWNTKTKTATDRNVQAFYEEQQQLEALLSERIIDVEEYNKRLQESIGETLGLQEIEITAKRVTEVYKEQATEISEFQKQAARNTQDIIGDTIYGAFTGRKQDILADFSDMISRLVAQAIAANLGEKLFGTDGKGGGWIDSALSMAGNFFGFGGGRAFGGPVTAGTMYRVNEREPEFFKPNVSGKVIPLSKMVFAGGGGRGSTIIQNFPPDTSRRTVNQAASEAARRQRIASSRLG